MTAPAPRLVCTCPPETCPVHPRERPDDRPAAFLAWLAGQAREHPEIGDTLLLSIVREGFRRVWNGEPSPAVRVLAKLTALVLSGSPLVRADTIGRESHSIVGVPDWRHPILDEARRVLKAAGVEV